MDSEIIYSLVGIVIFIAIIVFTLRSDVGQEVQTREEKRQQIVAQYAKQLKETLEPLRADRSAMMAKKSELLKQMSDELAMNIFFDQEEIREIILDLTKGSLH